ncbi:hypothetical protein ACOSQ2_005047 [Xanthoceras sorbifolium]
MLPNESCQVDTLWTATKILEFVKSKDMFLNAMIAYRILLTIPITMASAERSFSKLKLLKSYLWSTMTQDKLNALVLICIENDMLEKIQYDDIIDEFASRSVSRKTFK